MRRSCCFVVIFLGFSSLFGGSLPDWYPKDYDLQEGSRAVMEILRSQGTEVDFEHPHAIQSLIFSDADHTLLKTNAPIMLRDKRTGQLVVDPETGKLIRLPNRSFMHAIVELKQKHPNLAWESIEVDFDEMGSVASIDKTPPIDHMVSILRRAYNPRTTREFIITARSALSVPPAFNDYFEKLGVHLDGVFLINNPQMVEQLKMQGRGFSEPQKKAVVMAAIMKLYSRGGALKEVSYYDDGDQNLQMAMELLPKLFPDVCFRFFDVVHVGDNHFCLQLVAFTCGEGKLFRPEEQQNELTPEAIRAYSSDDAPLPDEINFKCSR